MTVRTATRTAFLTDVYTCALEGGIGYWATCSSYRWSNDPRATIKDIAGDPHEITLDTIARGVNAVFRGTPEVSDAQRMRPPLPSAPTPLGPSMRATQTPSCKQHSLGRWSTDNPTGVVFVGYRGLGTSETAAQKRAAVCAGRAIPP
ncbi:hypothetical protein ACWFOS_07200 [Gordonia terrae]